GHHVRRQLLREVLVREGLLVPGDRLALRAIHWLLGALAARSTDLHLHVERPNRRSRRLHRLALFDGRGWLELPVARDDDLPRRPVAIDRTEKRRGPGFPGPLSVEAMFRGR